MVDIFKLGNDSVEESNEELAAVVECCDGDLSWQLFRILQKYVDNGKVEVGVIF